MQITSQTAITDAHMHLPVNFSSLPEKKNALLREMHKNNICRGVVISDSELTSAIGTLQECTELFEACSDIAVVGGISPYIRYREQLRLLEQYLAARRIAGIKLYSGHEPIFLNDPVLTPVYSLAEQHGVPVLFHSGWDHPQYSAPNVIRQAAKEHPRVRFVCCHCCYPDIRTCIQAVSALSNVYFDISSIADSDPSAFRAPLERFISDMPERFIFGSDYGSCSQKAHLDFAASLHIPEKNRKLLLHGNAGKLYFGGR